MKTRILLLFLILFALLPSTSAVARSDIYFNDSDPNLMRLGNAHLELVLGKTNGAIKQFIDKAAGASLTLGSRNDCLWGAVFSEASRDYVGGCSYARSAPRHFSYAWNPANALLTLNYTWEPGADQRVDAIVIITASESSYLDMQLTVSNDWEAVMEHVLFPSDLVFVDDVVQAGYGPFLIPGVLLKPGFFTSNRSYVPTYPSDAAFADYLALDVNGGHLAFFAANPTDPVQPVALGYIDDDDLQPGTFFTYHSFYTWTASGQDFTTPLVRIHVGQPARDTIVAYRVANSIDTYPSLDSKLGERLFQLAEAPLIKADAHAINRSFRDWIPELRRLPSPALLHPVAFQPGGHDEHYPDFLPPDPRWGTTADFLAMVSAAQDRGIMVMPYINPTRWDDESPTMQNLPSGTTIDDIAVLDRNGQPVMETYRTVYNGYVVSPFASLVKQRLDQLLAQWRDEVPVDFIFEDQIGARRWTYDFNASAPNPLAYSEGWLDHAASYASQGLMTEMGWDRLARDFVGFHGSLLTWAREFDYPEQFWGAGNWEIHPLALWLFHDKVLLYQHDLSVLTMSQDKGVLTWNLVTGSMLSYDWQSADNDPLNNPWLDLVALLQRTVAARYAGLPLVDYHYLTDVVTQSDFGSITVIANWHPTLTHWQGGYDIAPGGFLASAQDESVLAGVFVNRFDGILLSAGEHYIVIERTPMQVNIHQPVGATTFLSVPAPAAWQEGHALNLLVFDRHGNLLGQSDYGVDGRRINFIYRMSWNGQEVGRYELASGAQIFMPCLLINTDPVVDIIDVQLIANALGKSIPPAAQAYDLNADSVIDSKDIRLVVRCWIDAQTG